MARKWRPATTIRHEELRQEQPPGVALSHELAVRSERLAMLLLDWQLREHKHDPAWGEVPF